MLDNTFETKESQFTDTQYRHDNVVRPYKESKSVVYPHLLLTCDKIERFRVEALKGILKGVSSAVSDDYIDVYMSLKGVKVHIGRLSRKVLKSLLCNKVFSTLDKKIYTDKDTYFEGDMLFAFCSVSE